MKFAISTKNEVLKFGEVRSSSSLKSLFATQVIEEGQTTAKEDFCSNWMRLIEEKGALKEGNVNIPDNTAQLLTVSKAGKEEL
mgnify:CR=1 FL=1